MTDATSTNTPDHQNNSQNSSDANGFTSNSKDGKLHIGITNETEDRKGIFGWAERIWIPVGGAAITLVATVLGAYLGFRFSSAQETNAEVERMASRAAEISSARHAVVADYAKNVTDRITSNPDAISEKDFQKLLYGETITTFKRLDDSRGESGETSEIQELKATASEKIEQVQTNQTILRISQLFGRDDRYREFVSGNAADAVKSIDGFDDADDLKGNLIRFLYVSELLHQRGPIRALPHSLVSGADLRRINLSNQPLHSIDLSGAWMSWGNLSKSDLRLGNLFRADLQHADLRDALLRGANLEEANLQDADLRRAQLQGAELVKADLRRADLRGANLTDVQVLETSFIDACYDSDTLGLEGLDPNRLGLRAMLPDQADQPCSGKM